MLEIYPSSQRSHVMSFASCWLPSSALQTCSYNVCFSMQHCCHALTITNCYVNLWLYAQSKRPLIGTRCE